MRAWGLRLRRAARLPVSFRERDFPRDGFRGCRHFFMFRPLRLRRLPDRSYRCEFPHRAAETFTSGHIVLCYLRTLRICYPSEYRIQVIDGKRTFTFQDLVAVGMPVARHPPHRPVLALLTHTVPTLDNGADRYPTRAPAQPWLAHSSGSESGAGIDWFEFAG